MSIHLILHLPRQFRRFVFELLAGLYRFSILFALRYCFLNLHQFFSDICFSSTRFFSTNLFPVNKKISCHSWCLFSLILFICQPVPPSSLASHKFPNTFNYHCSSNSWFFSFRVFPHIIRSILISVVPNLSISRLLQPSFLLHSTSHWHTFSILCLSFFAIAPFHREYQTPPWYLIWPSLNHWAFAHTLQLFYEPVKVSMNLCWKSHSLVFHGFV